MDDTADGTHQPYNELASSHMDTANDLTVPMSSAEPPEPQFTANGRPARPYRLPLRFRDIPPEPPAPLPPLPLVPPGSYAIPRVILHVSDCFRTAKNRFSLLRDYRHRPSHDPDSFITPDDLSNYPARVIDDHDDVSTDDKQTHNPPWPFKNMSIYLLMEWMITGSNQKSVGEIDRLAKNVLGAEEFNLGDIAGFNVRQEQKLLDDADKPHVDSPFANDGWIESNISISVPTGSKDGHGQSFSIPGLHHRPLLEVMKAALADFTAHRFHFTPFKRFWNYAIGKEQRCYDEAFTSDAWLKAHDELQKEKNEPDCKLEKVILGLMFWSDSTHLASFGTAKVWPLYMYFGNLSKYLRAKPNSAASHHIAYIPSVSSFCFSRWYID